MSVIEYFDYEEECILISIMRSASKNYIECELEKMTSDDPEMLQIIKELKGKVRLLTEDEIVKLFFELPLHPTYL